MCNQYTYVNLIYCSFCFFVFDAFYVTNSPDEQAWETQSSAAQYSLSGSNAICNNSNNGLNIDDVKLSATSLVDDAVTNATKEIETLQLVSNPRSSQSDFLFVVPLKVANMLTLLLCQYCMELL